jgi:hypothetical protein
MSIKLFLAFETNKLLKSGMQVYMFLKIRALRKTFRTIRYYALERLLLGVNSQMVEEIAPLSEFLATAWVLALHNSS